MNNNLVFQGEHNKPQAPDEILKTTACSIWATRSRTSNTSNARPLSRLPRVLAPASRRSGRSLSSMPAGEKHDGAMRQSRRLEAACGLYKKGKRPYASYVSLGGSPYHFWAAPFFLSNGALEG